MTGDRDEPEARFDAAARKVSQGPIGEVVASAREILGGKLLAYIGQVNHTRWVTAWAVGSETLDAEVERRLRAGCYAAVLLYERDGKATIQSWMMGMVPELDDASPAGLLHGLQIDDAIERVEQAARNFWVDG